MSPEITLAAAAVRGAIENLNKAISDAVDAGVEVTLQVHYIKPIARPAAPAVRAEMMLAL